LWLYLTNNYQPRALANLSENVNFTMYKPAVLFIVNFKEIFQITITFCELFLEFVNLALTLICHLILKKVVDYFWRIKVCMAAVKGEEFFSYFALWFSFEKK
jgi:hypothetical protein